MPELPEVEAARRLVDLHCKGRTIVSVDASDDEKVFCGRSPSDVAKALKSRTVVATHRKGKYFWFHLSGDGPHILFHFGMAGYLCVKDKGKAKYVRTHDDGSWPPRFVKLELTFDDGGKMAYADGRRFGRIKLLDDVEAEEPVCKLGPDAYLQLPPSEPFTALLTKQRRSLKSVLLDQAVLSGIGNWVADEVLYQASLHPDEACRDLDDGQVAALRGAIETVLEQAIAVNADSERLPKDWLFHFRWTGKVASKDFHGAKVSFIESGGRTTAYVPSKQKRLHSSHATAREPSSAAAGTSVAAAGQQAGKARSKAKSTAPKRGRSAAKAGRTEPAAAQVDEEAKDTPCAAPAEEKALAIEEEGGAGVLSVVGTTRAMDGEGALGVAAAASPEAPPVARVAGSKRNGKRQKVRSVPVRKQPKRGAKMVEFT